MLTYTMDVEERSRWIVSTPSAAETAQPFYCSEVGDFYARDKFTTARSNKNSYLVFYTLGGKGRVRQGTHIDGTGVAAAGAQLGLPRLVPVRLGLSQIRPHFDTLFSLLGTESVANTARIGVAVHAILAELVVASLGQGPNQDDDPVALSCSYIERHYAKKLSVDDLAREAAVSPSYLIRLFKHQMGTTPHDYLLRYRISRAKELLGSTTLTSAAIAERVGFASESNFSYRFSKMVGMGPRAYRQSTPELVLE